MAAGSFAEGLARGIIQGDELQGKREDRRRAAALDMANITMNQQKMQMAQEQSQREGEKFGWEKAERERLVAMREEIADTFRNRYGPQPDGTTIYLGNNGDFDRQSFQILGEKFWKFARPEEADKALKQAEYFEKKGVNEAVARFFATNGQDTEALQNVAHKFGLKKGSVTMQVKNGTYMLGGETLKGEKIEYDAAPYLAIMDFPALLNIKKNKLADDKTQAEIDENRADANYKNAAAGSINRGERATKGSQATENWKDFDSASQRLSAYFPGINTGMAGQFKGIPDEEAQMIVRKFAMPHLDAGVTGHKAFSLGYDKYNEVTQGAAATLASVINDIKFNPNAYKQYGFASAREAEGAVMSPDWQANQLRIYRRALIQKGEQQPARPSAIPQAPKSGATGN